MSVLRRLSEAATSAAQAVIIPTAVISIVLSALALMPRKYVTAQQAAEYIGVSARTIRTKIAEGVLTGYRIPGPDSRAIRLDLNEIERMMTAIPAVIKPKQPAFGPNAHIVDVDPEELADQDGQDEDGVG
jgi:excisionase family DNA binding protein